MAQKKATDNNLTNATPPVSQAQEGGHYEQAQYHDPVRLDKGKAKWLTFEYIMAMVAVVFSVVLIVRVIAALFSGWVTVIGVESSLMTKNIGGVAATLLPLGVETEGTGIILAATLAGIFGFVALPLFGRVSRAVPERPGFTKTTEYKVTTYGALAILSLIAVVFFAKLITVLISSLLFIGVSNAGAVYSSLYLVEFIPYLLGLGVVSAALYCVGKIALGRNMSKLLSWILIIVAVATLVAAAITVAVKSHGTPTVRTTTNTTTDTWKDFRFDRD